MDSCEGDGEAPNSMTHGIRRLVVSLGVLCLLLAFYVFAGRVGIVGAFYVAFHNTLREWAVLDDPRARDRALSDREVAELISTKEIQERMAAVASSIPSKVAMQVADQQRHFSVILASLGLALLIFGACAKPCDESVSVRRGERLPSRTVASPLRVGCRLSARSTLIMASLGVLFLLSSLFVLASRREAQIIIHEGFAQAHREWVRLSSEQPADEGSIEAQSGSVDAVWHSANATGPRGIAESIATSSLVLALFFGASGVTLLAVCLRGRGVRDRPRSNDE